MNISTLARRAGLSPSGVRWYEAKGILPCPARRDNGYRTYDEVDLSRLRLILTLRRLGLSPVDAGRLASTFGTGRTDLDLTTTLEHQRRRIAEEHEELQRLELELADLERTIAAATGDRELASLTPITVLFLCNGNSGRSQIAEALLGRFGGDHFGPLSAGTRPRDVHPLAVRALAEVGIDWAGACSKHVGDLLDRRLDYVITLSDTAREECPSLPGRHSSLHWHLDDPAAVEGTEDQCLEAFRATRTELSVRLRPFIEIARRAAGHLQAIAGPALRVKRARAGSAAHVN